MEIHRPLFWHQGLFLQPQHFQLLDSSLESRLAPLQQLMAPHFWGTTQVEFKKAALALKSFGIVKGKFMFPDGSYVEVPGNAVVEERSFDEAWIDGGKPLQVFLGLKKWNAAGDNVTVVKKGESLANVSTRFVAFPDPEEVKDLHAGGPVGHVKKMDHLVKIFWGNEKDNLGDYVLLPVAQIERSGAEIIFSNQFVPPSLSLSGSDQLVKLVKEIGDQLLSRSRELELHKSQRGIHRAEFGSRDMVYLLALRTINRYLPWLRHYSEAPQIHPWHIYGILRQIVGDLSCFSERFDVMGESVEENQRPMATYDHQALWEIFSNAQKLIIRMLDEITAGPDHVVPMVPTDGIYSADLKPVIFDGSNHYYLALTTDRDKKAAIDAMDSVAKLSSRQHLGLLISHALPGISVEHLALPPQELPRRGNVLYFSIDAHGEQWAHVKREQNLSLSWDGAPEGLQVELMVVSK
jgi:type VI secretion system protein ImpJ